jgi:hypothetical protein
VNFNQIQKMRTFSLYEIEQGNQNVPMHNKGILIGKFTSMEDINGKIVELVNKHKGVQKFDTQEIRLGSNEKETTYLLDTRVVIQEKIVILENILIVEH